MAQPQQQFQMPPQPQGPFSPPQSTTSPGAGNQQQQFPFPPNKRQRLSPNPPSQPTSPYVQSPYGMSPGAPGTPSADASPHFANVHLPNVYNNSPYSNGHSTQNLNLPQSQPSQPPTQYQSTQPSPQYQSSQPSPQYQPPQPPVPYQSPLTFPHQNQGPPPNTFNNYMMAPQGTGAMGPPSKPIDRSKEDDSSNNTMDVLGGTGVDLKLEEQYIYNNSFNSQLSGSQSGTVTSGNSFTQFPPGDERSFYGAGPANAIAEIPNTSSQDELLQRQADRAWEQAARALAMSRQNELANSFLAVGTIQMKVDKIARDNGLGLNVGKAGENKMGRMMLPDSFKSSEVKTKTVVGDDVAMVATSGAFLQSDTMLADQVALISLATKQRLRVLLSDAYKLSRERQHGSHGIVPEEWADVAAPINSATASTLEGTIRNGGDSAVSPRSNPLKRSFSAAHKTNEVGSGSRQFHNSVVSALRSEAIRERDFEEARLRKRMGRASGDVSSRPGSVVPGTPGSVAPESTEKAPTKKEQNKKAQAKVNEAASHAAANVTTAQFLGGGSGLFGKKGKKYSWMTGGGGSASGASTPGRIMTQGLPGTPGSSIANPAPAKLTADGARRLGTWREDKEKGKGIQLRDWVAVLEVDGNAKMALQKAYQGLDISEPK